VIDQEQVSPPGPRTSAVRDVLVELGFVAAALVLYLLVREYTDGRTGQAVANARDVLAAEQWLGVAWEHPIQDATLAVPWLAAFVTQFYVWGYLPAVFGTLIWLFVRHRDVYRPFRNALLASGVLGMFIYAFYPCAPPWIGGEGFTDTVITDSLEGVARPEGITNHLGAIPSFHVGWVMLAAWAVFRVARSRLIRVLCIVWPAAMAYAVVATGNHWVLDIPAGAALAAVGVLVARRLAESPPTPAL
jgi:PAP2 superfamily